MHIAGLTNVLNFSGTFNDVPCDTILNRHLRYLGKCFCDPRKIWERPNKTFAFHNSSSNPVQSLELRKRQALYTEQEVMSKNEIKGQKLHENAAVFHWKT